MNLKQLASHTVDLEMLPADPVVLDVGSRWLDFSNAILAQRPGARVITMDPARDVGWDQPGMDASQLGIQHLRAALVGHGPKFQRLAHFSTGEGDFLTTQTHFPGWDKQPELYEVPCLTVREVMDAQSILHFDLVKLDCEGSEFDILEDWPGPIATQISVEFHDWDKPRYRSEGYYDSLWKKLPWYRPVQHQLSKQGTGVGHWDTLLVLRNGQ